MYMLIYITEENSMAWKSLGKDTPRRGDKPIEWMERTKQDAKFAWNIDKHFLAHLKSVAHDKLVSNASLCDGGGYWLQGTRRGLREELVGH